MMRTHRFTVPTEFLSQDQFELSVRIDPVLERAQQWIAENNIDMSKTEGAFEIHERPAIRKMQMSFGWDNTPHLIAGGIFRAPVLEIQTRSKH